MPAPVREVPVPAGQSQLEPNWLSGPAPVCLQSILFAKFRWEWNLEVLMNKPSALPGLLGLLLLAGILLVMASAKPHHKSDIPLQDATILIIRHAEKPDFGPELSPEGERRAQAYVSYFSNFTVDSQPLQLEYLAAAADSKQSERPRLTLKPLSKALHLGINLKYDDKDYLDLVSDLRTKYHSKAILICWHRGMIPQLVQALGADPLELLPRGLWPIDQFSWVLQLRFDQQGRLIPAQTKRIQQHLLPSDPPPTQ